MTLTMFYGFVLLEIKGSFDSISIQNLIQTQIDKVYAYNIYYILRKIGINTYFLLQPNKKPAMLNYKAHR